MEKVLSITGMNQYDEKAWIYVEVVEGELIDVTNQGDPRPGVRAQCGDKLNWNGEFLSSPGLQWSDGRRLYPDERSIELLNNI